MKPLKISLRSLRKTRFSELYNTLLLGQPLSEQKRKGLLQLAVLFTNAEDEQIQRLGYRIILRYSNFSDDYIPLYDIAINRGFIPVAKFIEENFFKEDRHDSFFHEFQSAYKENFRKGAIYLTEQQLNLVENLAADESPVAAAVIAPTSYGKSELILDSLALPGKSICILVPTKALIAQTKRRVLNSAAFQSQRKIVTHPEMFQASDKNVVSILTQERLLRLMQKSPALKFDLVYVDEAHNLLEDSERSRLLATAILLLRKKNRNAVFRFLTPFLVDHRNLELLHSDLSLQPLRIDEYLKSERLYCYDFHNPSDPPLEVYDQFVDAFVSVEGEDFKDDVSLIRSKMKGKNIIYANRPKHVEKIARRLAGASPLLRSEEVDRACKALAEYVHKDYFLIGCLRRGIAYHHGSVPDTIKLFLENIFSGCKDIAFISTTSTLLEGVNIPAERLFLLSYKKGRSRLSPAQFKNLIGRVCRLKEIFNPESGDLKLLEPEIYLIASDFIGESANIKKFMQRCMRVDNKTDEKAENVLLANADLGKKKLAEREAAESFLENLSPGIIKNAAVQYAQTTFGRTCFSNSLHEIDILNVESDCQDLVDDIIRQGRRAGTADEALDFINTIFLPRVIDQNLQRLSDPKTREFYAMLLNWRIKNVSYPEMIGKLLGYWKKREKVDPIVFVGGAWGDMTRDGGFRELWTDISSKSDAQRTNLAIVRIKEEQDLLDNSLMKFLEVLFELNLLEVSLYERIRFGTEDEEKIILMKSGFSAGLSGLLLSEYRDSVHFDMEKSAVQVDPEVREKMIANGENEIVIFELECNVVKS